MEISVIIPAYNAANTLDKCIKLVRKEIKKFLLGLYDKLGKIREFYSLKRIM